MTVTLSGNDLTTVIIDTVITEIHKASIPKWVNVTPSAEINIVTEKPFKISYMIRATHALKKIIDDLLRAHTAVNLTDSTYSFNNNVWVSAVTATWQGNANWASPWMIEVELIHVT